MIPPSSSGQAVTLYRLLSDANYEDFFLISNDFILINQKDLKLLNCKHYYLPSNDTITKTNFLENNFLFKLIKIFISFSNRVKVISTILKNEKPTSVIACSGDIYNIPAGFIACKLMRIPIFIYIFDDYVYQWTGKIRKVLKIFSPFIFKNCAGIIGPNEFICEEYHRRYNVEPTLVRNPFDAAQKNLIPNQNWPIDHNKIRIFYTGSIYHANLECFITLIKSIEKLTDYHLELHIYSAQPPDLLKLQGINGNQVFIHSHIPFDEILQQQQKADILFLPLAFNTEINEVIRTSAPAKMGDYLASGRPILALVPGDSFVAFYIRKYFCGLVVDQNKYETLANEMRNLITNSNLRNEIIMNAKHQARLDFSPELSRSNLSTIFTKN